MSSRADALARFRVLLERERDAVRAADLDALQALQLDKRTVLGELRAGRPDADAPDEARELDELGAFARYNVGLIRHLVSILRGVAGLPEAPVGYGGRGQWVPPPEPGRVRGAA